MMKRIITQWTAALALLVALAIPLGMWGAEGDVHDMGITQSTGLNNNALIPTINIAAQSYPVKTVTINWRYNKTIQNPVTIEVFVAGESWGTQTITGNTTADAVFEGTSTIGAIEINFTNNTGDGTGHGTFYVNSVKLTEGASSGPAPIYTVTLGDDNTELTQASAGASVILPTRNDIGDYSFGGWSETNLVDETQTTPDIIFAGEYTPTQDITLYPVYSHTESGSGTTNVTAEVTIANYASAHEWQNGTAYQPLVMDDNISIGGTISGNNFKYYTSDNSWRFYIGGSFTISAGNGAALTSFTLTFSGGLSYNNDAISSGTACNVSESSATISCTANAKITAISVSYTITGGATYYWSWPVVSTEPAVNVEYQSIAIEYTAQTGVEIPYSISNPVDGTNLTAASEDEWITNVTVGTGVVTFDATANGGTSDREGTITLTYGNYDTKVVTVTQGHYVAPAPEITAYPVELGYNATGGSISYNITHPVSGGILTAEVTEGNEGNWLTLGESLVTFSCSTNDGVLARTATVTLTYSYGDNQTVSANAVVTQNPDPELGTLDHPYTVAQARAVIEPLANNTPTSASYYATGIVKEIVTAWNPGYENITFNIVDNQGDEVFLQAYRCVSSSTADASEVQVNDVVVVFGQLKKYSGTYEFGQGCQLVSLTHPAATTPTITVANATIHANAAGADGTIDVTYENITDIDAEVYFCDVNGEAATYGNWILAEIDDYNNVYYLIDANDGEARTAYFMVYALDDDGEDVYSDIVTVSQDAYVADYATLPFEFDGGRADIDQTAGLTHQGLGSDYSSSPYLKFDTQDDNLVLKINEAPGVLTFAIKGTGNPWTGTFNVQASVDGQTYSNVATYTDDLGDTETKTINNLASGVRYIRWYFTAKASGCNVGVGDIHLAAYEAPQPAITLNSYSIEATAEETEGNLTVTYTEIETSLGASIYWFESDGVTSASEPDWMSASINTQLNVEYLIEENEGAARTAYFKVYGLDSEMNGVYSDLVTVSQAAAPQQYTLEVTSISNAEIIVFDATDPDETNWDYLFEGVDEVQVLGGTPIALSVSAEEGYALTSLMVNSVEHVNDIQGGVYTFTMPAENVTITVTAVESVTPAGGDYVRIIDLSQLTDGSKVIIAARYDADLTDGYYAMPGETSGKPTGVAFTSAISGGNEILPATIVDDEDTYYWTVNVTDDGYTFTNAESYQIGGKNGTDFVTGGNYIEWTITRQTASDNAMVSEYTGFVIKNGNYDRAFAFNGTAVFGAYATSNMTNNNASGYNFCLDFFVQQEPVEPVTYTTEMLTGYGEEEGHYYLIASPVYVDPANTNMLTDDNTDPENCTYDLYYFDQSEDDEWRNYRSEAFTLVPGQGYLYANVSDIQLTFTGVPYDGDGVIGLTNTADAEFGGWNLVGNPFGSAATISKAYYAMNAQGSGFEPKTQNDPVAVMQGVFVYTEENSTVTFTKIEQTPVEPEPEANMILNITKDCGSVIDRAIVRFGQSDQLPKFMFNPDNSKVYFTQGNKDYAIVRSNAQGEMPVNFKASKNGTYTLSVEPENVEMNYLHLIDNRTGADVDLLANPSYTFEANKGDNANRFRLVFKANMDVEENTTTETFAYYNGSAWVISNTGDATLQVIDMMGRVLRSEQISGNTTVNINEIAGVYMLRLVNGENVMVQKVVVR